MNIVIDEIRLDGRRHLQVIEVLSAAPGSPVDAWTLGRTLTTPIGRGSVCLAWLRLRIECLRQWGVSLPASSNPDPVVLS